MTSQPGSSQPDMMVVASAAHLVYSHDDPAYTLDPATVEEVMAVLTAAEVPLQARQILNAVCDARGVSRTRPRGAWSRSGNTTDLWPVSKVERALAELDKVHAVVVYTGAHPASQYLLPDGFSTSGATRTTRWFTRYELDATLRQALIDRRAAAGEATARNEQTAAELEGRLGLYGRTTVTDVDISLTVDGHAARRLVDRLAADAVGRATAVLDGSDSGSKIIATLFEVSERYRRIRSDTSDLLPPEQVAVAVMRARGQYEGALEMAAAITGTRQDDLVAAVRAYRKAERAADAAARDGLRRTATDSP